MLNKGVIAKSVTISNSYLIVISDDIPYLFIIDLNKRNIRKIKCPDGTIEKNIFSGVYGEKNNVALVPQKGKKIWIYDITLEIWVDINISNYIKEEQDCKFLGGRLVNGMLFVFGYNFNGVLAIDIYSHEIRVICRNVSFEYLSGISSVFWRNNIILPMRSQNKMILIDTLSLGYKLVNCNIESELANDGITFDGNNFYILKNSGNKIFRVNKEFEFIEKIELDCFFDNQSSYFCGIEWFNNKLVLFGDCGYSYIYDIKAKNSRIFQESVYHVKKLPGLRLAVCKFGKIEVWDRECNTIGEYTVELTENEIENYMISTGLNKLFHENKIFNLDGMIKVINK